MSGYGVGTFRIGQITTDGRHTFAWRRRSELERVVRQGDGAEVSYSYDAAGRLLSRMEKNDQGEFLSKRVFIWNDWELLAQAGLNSADEVLWRIENLPGPVGLDDSPQLRVTTHLHPADPEPETTRVFDLVRDEMGSVIAIIEDERLPDGETGIPPLKARILYDPYGRAHIEDGPELRKITHDVDLTSVDGIDQEPMTGEDGDGNPIILGISGSLVLKLSIAPDETSLGAGIELERWDETIRGFVLLSASDRVIAVDDGDDRLIDVMPLEGWLKGGRYRIRLTPALTDVYGRAYAATGETYPISVPGNLFDPAGDLEGLPVEIPVRYDSVEASAATLECENSEGEPEPCFPGGVNFLFQGAWTDPTTGIAYHRNRWYDPRTANWLSEDPLGAVDSPNLYAFVGWGPHVGVDPLGLCWFTGDNLGCGEAALAIAEGLYVDTTVDVIKAGGNLLTLGTAARMKQEYEAGNVNSFRDSLRVAGDAVTNTVTLGARDQYDAGATHKQVAKEISGVAGIERGSQTIGEGIGLGDSEMVLRGVGEFAGGTGQLAGWAAGAGALGKRAFTAASMDELTAATQQGVREFGEGMSQTARVTSGGFEPIQSGGALLPGEGATGTFDELVRAGSRGDNLTPHHMPSNEYMIRADVPGYTRGRGIAMSMEQPVPGTGGRHRATWSYGRSPDTSLSPRQALARDIWDARQIYRNQELYTPAIRRALQNVIKLNTEAWSVFGK